MSGKGTAVYSVPPSHILVQIKSAIVYWGAWEKVGELGVI